MMTMLPVQSSNIEAVGHDKETSELRIAFKGGKTYSYPGVPEEKFAALYQADSIGSHFHRHIKKFHEGRPV